MRVKELPTLNNVYLCLYLVISGLYFFLIILSAEGRKSKRQATKIQRTRTEGNSKNLSKSVITRTLKPIIVDGTYDNNAVAYFCGMVQNLSPEIHSQYNRK